MARVPIVATPQVALAPLSGERLRPVDNGGGALGGLGRGLQGAGRAISAAAQVEEDIAEREARVAAQEAVNRAAAAGGQMLHDPEKGLFTQSGKAAIDAFEPTMGAIRDQLDVIEKELPSKRAKDIYRSSVSDRQQAWLDAASRFVAGQRLKREAEASAATIGIARVDGVQTWQDPETSERHLGTGVNEIAAAGARAGRDADAILLDQLEFLSGARREIALRKNMADPAAGAAYFEQHKADFTPEDARAVLNDNRVRVEAREADARRIAAEARQAQAAAVRERREQLMTLRTQLDTGAGTSADWFALANGFSEIGDTSAAEGARARGNEVKASDTYRGATIGQLDQRIGQLQAKQGRGGLEPAEASELRGLQARRTETAGRLSQPGGALLQEQFATGAAPVQLDPRDPTTFRKRGTAAVAAAARQGGAVEPLLADEIRVMDGLMKGEASERLKVLRSIARFGEPRAIEGAARQLTSEADGDFRIAATLINTPGGEKTAIEVLRGRDALAIAPQVYQSANADAEFTKFAAPALSGMPPGYARDVKAAARAIYAERMRQSGLSGWDSNQWRGAINAALGGEDKGGLRHGGIATFKGTPVSVPPGWTGDGVFRRIATMDGDDLGRARVSKPGRWPDGSRVYTGQLREMVPVRLGGTRYGFLTRAGRLLGSTDGSPYVIDVAKLPWKQ